MLSDLKADFRKNLQPAESATDKKKGGRMGRLLQGSIPPHKKTDDDS
jgi:hypothetical protein